MDEIIDYCPACGQPIDYCLGHGDIGDPRGFAIIAAHDNGDHSECDPRGCDDAPRALSDCPWWDVVPGLRPEWARLDCGGRMLDTEFGITCENHVNAVRGRPNEYGFVCAEFDADGSCIHSDHNQRAGL